MEPQEVHGTELVAAAMWQAYGSYGLKESAQDRELEERVERHFLCTARPSQFGHETGCNALREGALVRERASRSVARRRRRAAEAWRACRWGALGWIGSSGVEVCNEVGGREARGWRPGGAG